MVLAVERRRTQRLSKKVAKRAGLRRRPDLPRSVQPRQEKEPKHGAGRRHNLKNVSGLTGIVSTIDATEDLSPKLQL